MVDVTEQAKQAYKSAIIKYLQERCKTDTYLAEACRKENKSLDGVVEYIIGEARKKAENDVAVIPDADVYDMAVHYILEDSLDCEPGKKKAVATDTNVDTSGDVEANAEEVAEKEKPVSAPKNKKTKKTIADEAQCCFDF